MRFPSKPPEVPGLQAFSGVSRYFASPLEKIRVKPEIDCSSNKCFGYFGTLIHDQQINFGRGIISPLDIYNQTLDYLSAICNEDGYLYPPQEMFVQLDPRNGERGTIEKPRSWKPADHFSLPPTHKIDMEGVSSGEAYRKGTGAFLLGLLSMLFETRLQFHTWIVDSKVKIMHEPRNVHFFHKDIEVFLSKALDEWETWPPRVKTEMINILHLHSKIPNYSGIWEKFTAAYLVFDGCFSVCKKLFGLHANSHKTQFKTVCDHFGIPQEKDAVDEIYVLRNDLFHSLKWGKGVLGFEEPNSKWERSDNLAKLTLRIVAGICGHQGGIIGTKWKNFSSDRL